MCVHYHVVVELSVCKSKREMSTFYQDTTFAPHISITLISISFILCLKSDFQTLAVVHVAAVFCRLSLSSHIRKCGSFERWRLRRSCFLFEIDFYV